MIWGYCRVSTNMEAQDISIEDQAAWIEAYANERHQPLRVFAERKSAKTTSGRPEFMAMMAELESMPPAQRPKQLVATAWDRLSRDMTDTLLLVRTLRRCRVELYLRNVGVVKADTFADRAAIVGQSMGGEAENEGRSMRMRASAARRRAEGKVPCQKAPYGIQLRGGFDTRNGAAAEWVERAFRWYAGDTEYGHLGAQRIVRLFQGEDPRLGKAPDHIFETATVDPETRRPKIRVRPVVWEHVRIRRLLEQPRYRGLIVSAELFDRAAEIRAGKPRWRSDRKLEYPLSGVVRCPTCPRSLAGRATGGGPVRWRRKDGSVGHGDRPGVRTRYYHCKICHVQFNAQRIETAFRSICQRLNGDPGLLRAWLAADDLMPADHRILRRELGALETETSDTLVDDKRRRAWDLALEASISAEDLAAQLKRMDSELQVKRTRIATIRAALAQAARAQRTAQDARTLLAEFWQLYDEATYEERRFLIGELTAKVIGTFYGHREGIAFRGGDGEQVVRGEARPPGNPVYHARLAMETSKHAVARIR